MHESFRTDNNNNNKNTHFTEKGIEPIYKTNDNTSTTTSRLVYIIIIIYIQGVQTNGKKWSIYSFFHENWKSFFIFSFDQFPFVVHKRNCIRSCMSKMNLIAFVWPKKKIICFPHFFFSKVDTRYIPCTLYVLFCVLHSFFFSIQITNLSVCVYYMCVKFWLKM